ncbi:YckD family protein [Peribacillus sp. B-H-3]|jgi:hypothetical protein|uniref:YckD family protein n=1 Tax=Peribacillus sp. B-H-3 TaxID=3400420 RepID=UPI003B01E235
MKKTALILLLVISMFTLSSASEVFANEQPAAKAEKVQLTDKQKSELSSIHEDILAKKKELIMKYVEYGMMSKEQGDKIIQRFEEHYNMLKENGYKMPGHYGHRHHNH